MIDLEVFYSRYRIDEFYNSIKGSIKPIRPFDRTRHKKLAFGVLPGFRSYELFFERYRSAVEILHREKLLPEKAKILDVGSGEGFFKFFFDADGQSTIEWHGVEVWKERAAFCRHIGYSISETNLEEGKLPHGDEIFDVVIASHVIEHIPNPEAIINELGRVLKPGGVLLIATPTKLPIISIIDGWYHKIGKRQVGDTQQAFTHNTIEKLTLNALNQSRESVIDKRGFRILSGRKLLPIEDWKWFYRLSVWAGKNMMYFVPEINLIVKKA